MQCFCHETCSQHTPFQLPFLFIITMGFDCLFFFFFFKSRPPYQVEKKGGGCVIRGSLLQDRLPVKFKDVKFKDMKFKHESVLRIDTKHSYFSNYFIICLQSVVEIILNCLLFAKKLFMFMHIVLYKEILKNRI